MRGSSAQATRPRPTPLIALAPDPSPARSWGGIASLNEIERIISGFAADVSVVREASLPARRRALALMMSASDPAMAERIAVSGFAADLVAALAPELVHRSDRVQAMIDQLDAAVDVPRPVLGREILLATPLLRLSPSVAFDVGLALVLAFARASAAALWAYTANGEVSMVAGAGDAQAMAPASPELAARVLNGQTVTAPGDGELAVTRIHSSQGPAAALLVFGEDVSSPACRRLLEAAEPVLMLALERRARPVAGPHPGPSPAHGGQDESLEDVVAAAQRRLSRLRFDLHDGPQQDVIMLADDLRRFRSHLGSLTADDDHAHLLGSVDDLEARLIALDGDLRRISVSVQSPFLHQKSFEDALTTLTDSFSGRSGLTPKVALDGDFTTLTDSQHITLLGLVREALNNVREHSQADQVAVRVSADAGAVTLSITDDGCGFEPETMLVRAARRGRLGLVGMHERVRLLGGDATITSRPGGPTVIAATLPPAPVGAPRRADR